MGGRSKSRSSSNNTVNTGALAQQGATQQAQQMGGAAQHQQNLQNSQLSHVMPAFGEMVKGAMGSFADNPVANFMGAALGMPIQMQTPEFLEEFINKYRPQEPAAAPQAPQQQPYNVNDDMRARMGMGSPYGAYGPYGQPNVYNVGGVRR